MCVANKQANSFLMNELMRYLILYIVYDLCPLLHFIFLTVIHSFRGKDMGASESKIAVETPKPDRSRQIRNDRISQLVDPRSPSTGIDRTPIQVNAIFNMHSFL